MATTFTVTIAYPDAIYARQAADVAFQELDRLERILSRHLGDSDIARINRLAAGQTLLVQPETLDCLQVALDAQRMTDGVFDISYGSTGQPSLPPPFELDAKAYTVRVRREGLRLDPGGIGKGFALDRMAALLADWEIESALLCASTSTFLALAPPPGEPGWSVTFGPDPHPRRVMLVRRAFSASGRSIRSDHIMDPRTRRPATGWERCWSAASSGALADALSTAFVAMGEEEIRACCSRHAEVSTWALRPGVTRVITFADRIPPAC